jgi:hypothetical protein
MKLAAVKAFRFLLRLERTLTEKHFVVMRIHAALRNLLSDNRCMD